jgi:hypothetical protein
MHLYAPATYLNVEKVLHAIQNLECRVRHDLHAVYRRLLDKGRNGLVRGGAVVRLIARTDRETIVSTVTSTDGKDRSRLCDLQQRTNDTLKVRRKRTGVLLLARFVQLVQPIREVHQGPTTIRNDMRAVLQPMPRAHSRAHANLRQA